MTISSQVKKQQAIEQDYLSKKFSTNKASIDSTGKLTFTESDDPSKRVTPVMRKLIQKDYENYIKDNSIKIESDKDRADTLNTYVNETGGVIPAADVATIRALQVANNRAARTYQGPTQVAYDAEIRKATQLAEVDMTKAQRVHDTTIAELPTEFKMAPKDENFKVGDLIKQLDADIDKEKLKDQQGVGSNFGADISDDEQVDIKSEVNRIAKEKFTTPDGKKIAYPAWILKNAYEAVGVNSFLKQRGWGLWEEVTTDPFEAQLAHDMNAWLDSEKNPAKRDQAAGYLDAARIKKSSAIQAAIGRAKINADRKDGLTRIK